MNTLQSSQENHILEYVVSSLSQTSLNNKNPHIVREIQLIIQESPLKTLKETIKKTESYPWPEVGLWQVYKKHLIIQLDHALEKKVIDIILEYDCQYLWKSIVSTDDLSYEASKTNFFLQKILYDIYGMIKDFSKNYQKNTESKLIFFLSLIFSQLPEAVRFFIEKFTQQNSSESIKKKFDSALHLAKKNHTPKSNISEKIKIQRKRNRKLYFDYFVETSSRLFHEQEYLSTKHIKFIENLLLLEKFQFLDLCTKDEGKYLMNIVCDYIDQLDKTQLTSHHLSIKSLKRLNDLIFLFHDDQKNMIKKEISFLLRNKKEEINIKIDELMILLQQRSLSKIVNHVFSIIDLSKKMIETSRLFSDIEGIAFAQTVCDQIMNHPQRREYQSYMMSEFCQQLRKISYDIEKKYPLEAEMLRTGESWIKKIVCCDQSKKDSTCKILDAQKIKKMIFEATGIITTKQSEAHRLKGHVHHSHLDIIRKNQLKYLSSTYLQYEEAYNRLTLHKPRYNDSHVYQEVFRVSSDYDRNQNIIHLFFIVQKALAQITLFENNQPLDPTPSYSVSVGNTNNKIVLEFSYIQKNKRRIVCTHEGRIVNHPDGYCYVEKLYFSTKK